MLPSSTSSPPAAPGVAAVPPPVLLLPGDPKRRYEWLLYTDVDSAMNDERLRIGDLLRLVASVCVPYRRLLPHLAGIR